MGIFGIKTRKEKEAEAAKLRAAKREEEILESIEYWDSYKCRQELEAYEKGQRSHFTYKIVSAIKNKRSQLGYEAGLRYKRSELDKKIAAKQAEIERLRNRDPWTYSGGDGYHFRFRSTENDKRMASEVSLAERELARLQRERDNVGKEW